jgi:hypothetical protein
MEDVVWFQNMLDLFNGNVEKARLYIDIETWIEEDIKIKTDDIYMENIPDVDKMTDDEPNVFITELIDSYGNQLNYEMKIEILRKMLVWMEENDSEFIGDEKTFMKTHIENKLDEFDLYIRMRGIKKRNKSKRNSKRKSKHNKK